MKPSAHAYHGSSRRLTELHSGESKHGIRTMNDLGIWLTSNPGASSFYGRHVHAVVVPRGTYRPARDAPDMPAKIVFDRDLMRHFGLKGSWEKVRNMILFDPDYLREWKGLMLRKGYQGVLWKSSYIDRDPETEPPHDVYLVFKDRLPVIDSWKSMVW